MFPKKTIINKKIPKQRFYDNAEVKNKVKQELIKNIESIILANKLSKETINVNPTKEIEEILVMQVKTKQDASIEDVLLTIDKSVPYPILFEVIGEKSVFFMAYKKRNKVNEDNFVVEKYFSKKNSKKIEVELNNCLKAINIELIYHNILRVLIGSEAKDSIEDVVALETKKQVLEKEIIVLENKVKVEKQADKQYEYFMDLKQKKKELGKLLG